MMHADGRNLGTDRKSHIPDGLGYQEKLYFIPGDTGFKAWRTRHGTFGAAICWDQWFPDSLSKIIPDEVFGRDNLQNTG